MHTTIQKWGNSLAVRIPKAFVKEAHVAYGTPVDLSVDDGKIVIDPRTEPEYRLEDLLKGVTKRNLHAEVDTGKAVGREVW
jgi:antitoxin MazE